MTEVIYKEGLPKTHGVLYSHVPKFPNHYCVGTDGTVWSRILRGSKKGTLRTWWELKLTPCKGYLVVNMRRDGQTFQFDVHALILEVFVGARPEGMECRHLDGDPKNNQLTNLCWGTPKENSDDILRHGRRKRGETHYRHKLTELQVLKIREELLCGKLTHCELASLYKVHPWTITSIAIGKSWRHLGTSEGLSRTVC